MSARVVIPLSNQAVMRRVEFREALDHPVQRFPDGHDIRYEVWTWCEANLRGSWCWWADHDNRQRILEFTDPRSAVLFKLRWGGR